MRTAFRPRPGVLRRDAGLYGYERALARKGFAPVAGVDEAGRGACAGPLVVASVILGRRIAGLADSKLLGEPVRERLHDRVVAAAQAVSVVVIPPGEIDEHGLHKCNVAGVRRAVAGLGLEPGYILVDGFPVPGLPVPSLAMWKGDRVAACVAAASIVAKVTRDRLMRRLHERYPEYGFDTNKGYVTAAHRRALARYGPCPEHRFSFVTVARVTHGARNQGPCPWTGQDEDMHENEVGAGAV
ncbi:ribonuclease HII [Thermobispora bispora]|uniref:ribonuclease HII n=1 Tax=Thermobispora bispora TaxID=2006 RepID=UPI00333FC60F